MSKLIIILAILAFLILCFQGYSYVTTRTGRARRESCRRLGIFYFCLGIIGFVVRSAPVTFAGLILLMMGLRLMAHGMVRHGKTGYRNSDKAGKFGAPLSDADKDETGEQH